MYGIAPGVTEAASEDIFVYGKESVETHLGLVVKCKLDIAVPNGWRRLTREQGTKIELQLKTLLGTWSIVAFSDGKIDGSGYGSKIHSSYGSQCGEMFMIREQTAPQQYPPYQGGSQQFTMSDAPGFNQKHPVPPYLNPTNPNIKVKSFSPIHSSPNQFIQQYQNIQTSIGRVIKCKLDISVPMGWRKLTRKEGQHIKEELNTLLDMWSIVAFADGKIDGDGYGNKIHSSYGKECREMFIVNQGIKQ